MAQRVASTILKLSRYDLFTFISVLNSKGSVISAQSFKQSSCVSCFRWWLHFKMGWVFCFDPRCEKWEEHTYDCSAVTYLNKLKISQLISTLVCISFFAEGEILEVSPVYQCPWPRLHEVVSINSFVKNQHPSKEILWYVSSTFLVRLADPKRVAMPLNVYAFSRELEKCQILGETQY